MSKNLAFGLGLPVDTAWASRCRQRSEKVLNVEVASFRPGNAGAGSGLENSEGRSIKVSSGVAAGRGLEHFNVEAASFLLQGSLDVQTLETIEFAISLRMGGCPQKLSKNCRLCNASFFFSRPFPRPPVIFWISGC